MPVRLLNDARFLGSLPSHLAQWLDEDFADRVPGSIYLICENAHTIPENDRIIAHGLRRTAQLQPTPDDVVVIDRSSEVGGFLAERAELLRSFGARTSFPLDRVIYASQNRGLEATIREAFAEDAPQHLFFHQYAAGLAYRYAGQAYEDFGYDARDGRTAFISTNLKLRPHRAVLSWAIRSSRLADHTILSDCRFDDLWDRERAVHDVARDYPDFEEPVRADLETSRPTPPLPGEELYGWPAAATRSLFTVVAESEYRGDAVRITEKTLKPIVYHRPFLIIGGRGSLRFLKEWGFETFAEAFDESYDEIEGPQERMRAVISLMHDLLRDPFEVAARCREVCARNRQHFTTTFLGVLRDNFRVDMARCLARGVSAG